MISNIGNNGDPCGIPAGVANASVVVSLNTDFVVLAFRKLSTHFVIDCWNFSFLHVVDVSRINLETLARVRKIRLSRLN